jgi:hypothetical protein
VLDAIAMRRAQAPASGGQHRHRRAGIATGAGRGIGVVVELLIFRVKRLRIIDGRPTEPVRLRFIGGRRSGAIRNLAS